jgi:hypothetical protein
MTAPIPFAGSQLDQTRHVSAFFNSADEEYRVLLPWGCWEHLVSQQGQQDSQNCARTSPQQIERHPLGYNDARP